MDAPSYEISAVLIALLASVLLTFVGATLRKSVPVFDKLYLPAAVIGGIVGLIMGPQVLGGQITQVFPIGEVMGEVYKIWKQLPSFLITIVFAALLMGKPLPRFQRLWSKASPHIMTGYLLAWGQYIVGILLALFILVPFFDSNPLSSALIAIGFQGGYGTAAGLGNTYAQLGFEEGYDLALGMATAGKVAAILVGLVLINLAVNREKMKSPEDKQKDHLNEEIPSQEAQTLAKQQRAEQHYSADTLILHFGLLGMAVFLGWVLKESALFLESFAIADMQDSVVQYIPLFPMALIGGGLVQFALTKGKLDDYVNAQHLHSLSHSMLDMLIVVAIATLSLKTIAANWEILAALVSAGVGWNLLVFFLVAPRFYRNAPWTRGIADFAHATGSTTTGLLLMKVIDPNDKTGARGGFSLKQPLYEPVVGGGFVTALALPLLYTIGLWATLAIAVMLLVATLLLAWRTLDIQDANILSD